MKNILKFGFTFIACLIFLSGCFNQDESTTDNTTLTATASFLLESTQTTDTTTGVVTEENTYEEDEYDYYVITLYDKGNCTIDSTTSSANFGDTIAEGTYSTNGSTIDLNIEDLPTNLDVESCTLENDTLTYSEINSTANERIRRVLRKINTFPEQKSFSYVDETIGTSPLCTTYNFLENGIVVKTTATVDADGTEGNYEFEITMPYALDDDGNIITYKEDNTTGARISNTFSYSNNSIASTTEPNKQFQENRALNQTMIFNLTQTVTNTNGTEETILATEDTYDTVTAILTNTGECIIKYLPAGETAEQVFIYRFSLDANDNSTLSVEVYSDTSTQYANGTLDGNILTITIGDTATNYSETLTFTGVEYTGSAFGHKFSYSGWITAN